MSGIVGIYHRDGQSASHANVERMAGVLFHRGPDAGGVWNSGPIGLGHRMLWTTPESIHERLPFEDKTRNLAISSDARLDNREELVRVLGIGTLPADEITDSEIIVAAYEKWGEQCPDKLVGDFAFVIWDGDSHKVFCARDHFGVKPFYYHLSEKVFVVATEIKALLCLPIVPREVNEVKIADYLASVYDDTAITFYKDILRLPPHHCMTISRNEARLQSYWSFDPSVELKLNSNAEYAEGFRERFEEAVRCRLRSAFPVGSMLSGGLDSSSISCMARNLLVEDGADSLPTFSAIFDEVTECDERPFINAVLGQDNFDPHYLHADQVSPLADYARILWHQDEAFDGGNLFIPWGLYKQAQERGVRIMLDGYDGDTTVSHGVKHLTVLARNRQWLALARHLPTYAKNFGLPLSKLTWRYARIGAVGPMIRSSRVLTYGQRVRRALTRRVRRNRNDDSSRTVWNATLNAEFMRRIGFLERQESLLKANGGAPKTEREHHYQKLCWGGLASTLEVINKASAAFSIEARFPYWDKRLAEFCLALPPEQKIYRGWTRMVVRRALDGILPFEVQWRGGKSNLGPNLHHGLRTFEGERLRDIVLNKSSQIEMYVDVNELRKSYDRLISGNAISQDVIAMLKVASLTMWLERAGLTP